MWMCELHISPVNACYHKACHFLNVCLNGLLIKPSVTLTMHVLQKCNAKILSIL